MHREESLRLERLALLIGTIIGQTNELLNQIQKNRLPVEEIYKSLFDINNMAALHLHELYYEDKK
jgi:hypothetical protein